MELREMLKIKVEILAVTLKLQYECLFFQSVGNLNEYFRTLECKRFPSCFRFYPSQ